MPRFIKLTLSALVLVALAAGGRAYRAHHQEWDPDRGVREPAALAWLRFDGGGAGGRGLRLRPILMTTSAMILGALPIALAGGPGAESRAPIGWVIVGGLSFGTLLTLFVIPTAYTLLARRGRATGTEAYEPSPAPGAEGRAPIGWVIVGGLSFGRR